MRVRAKLLDAMARAIELERFEDDMIGHLGRLSSWHAETSGEGGLRRTIRLGVRRAGAYGVTHPCALRLYIDLMLLFGSMFDTDPLLPWAGEVLRDPNIAGEEERMSRLHASMLAYRDAVAGPERRGSLDALRAIQRLLGAGIPAAEILVEPRAVGAMWEVHPRFCAYVGETRLRDLLRRGREEAARLALMIDGGMVLVTALMFTIGHGFADDPLFPWVRAALEDPALGSPEARVAGLRRQAETNLDAALRSFTRRRADAAD
jgi:hypothetical protein